MKLSAEIVSLIKQQEAELTMTLVYVASRGDLVHLQKLMHGGVDPNKADYDGRTPLVRFFFFFVFFLSFSFRILHSFRLHACCVRLHSQPFHA
jgi:hypothetical protein